MHSLFLLALAMTQVIHFSSTYAVIVPAKLQDWKRALVAVLSANLIFVRLIGVA